MSLTCSECNERLEEGMEGIIVRSSVATPIPSLDGEDFESRLTHEAHFTQWVPKAVQVLSHLRKEGGEASPEACAECGGKFTKKDPAYILGTGFCEGLAFSGAELSRDDPFVYVHARHVDPHIGGGR